MSAKVKCPGCNRVYAFKPEFAGKSATCKCGHKIHFPKMPVVSASPPVQEACPNCEAFLPAGAVLCTQCGYNKNTGRIVTGATAATARRGAPAVPISKNRGIPAWAMFSVATVGALLVAIGGWVIYQTMLESPRKTSPSAVRGAPSTLARETPGAMEPAPADGTAAKLYPARQFSSPVPMYVYVGDDLLDAGAPLFALPPLGRTPADKPLDIPACDAWCVSPADTPLANVVKEMQAQAVPGLALPPSATNDDLALLKGLTGLQTLYLRETRVTDAGVAHLRDLTGLRMLNLMGTQVTDAGLAHLKGLTGLQALNLLGTKVTNAGLEQLQGLTGLHALDLSHTRVTDAGLAQLKGLTELQTLNLWHTQVTDAGLECLKDLKGLRSLSLSDTQVTDAGLAHLQGLTGLQTLDLDRTQVSDAGLEHVKDLTGLRTLDLWGTQVTDAGLARLQGLTGLETLNLTGTRVTDAGLAQLRGRSGLRTLILNDTQVTDAGLAHLHGLTGLQRLELSGTKVTNTGLAHLQGLTALQTLDLSRTQVTDTGLAHLQGLTGLRRLNLYDTMVTDAALAQLKGLTALVINTSAGQTRVGDPAQVLFTVSKETTVITGPLRLDGTVDYVAAINERYGQGVTPENNGFVKWLEVVGTGDNVLSRRGKSRLLQMCGAKEMAAGAEVWEPYGEYMKRTKGSGNADVKAIEELDATRNAPWRAEDYPNLARYFNEKNKLITTVAEVTGRPKWWLPIGSDEGKALAAGSVPSLGLCRDATRVLCSRALLRGTAGDMEGCLADIQTARKLARQVGSGATLIERLVGVAMDTLATQALAAVAASGKLSEAQSQAALAALDALPPPPTVVECVDIGERWNALDAIQWIALGDHDAVTAVSILALGESEGSGPGELLGAIDRAQVDWNAVFRKHNQIMDDKLKVLGTPDISRLKAELAAIEKATADQGKAAVAAAPSFAKRPEETRAAYTERVANLLISLLQPSVGKAEELYRRSLQDREMVRVVVAAAQLKAKTGKWPAKVEELAPSVLKELPKDMYSANGALPFRYVVKQNGVRVYSVGENGKDDGGVRDSASGKDDLGVGADPTQKPLRAKSVAFQGVKPVLEAQFAAGTATQEVKLPAPATGRYFCLESLDTQGGNKFAAVAELDLLGKDGKLLSRDGWTIAYADSEEQIRENGRAENALDGKPATYWHTQWSDAQPDHPHRLILDLGQSQTITAFRYVPRPGADNVGGRIKNYRIYIGDTLVQK
jgi:internalin A